MYCIPGRELLETLTKGNVTSREGLKGYKESG